MADKILFEELILFIREEANEFKQAITRETLIEDDLGITGEEAAEMVLNYSKKYNVDVSSFNFERYFNEEPCIFLINPIKSLLTIGHMEKGILAGRLNEEIIGY